MSCLPRRLRSLYLVACCLPAAWVAAASATPPEPPVLQLSGDDFPELIVISHETDSQGEPLAPACAGIRSKRIDELDPLWKQAVERIHLDCEDVDLGAQDDGTTAAVTVVTGFLRPGLVQFAGIPVAEIRLMDSEQWGDHQYLLDRPFEQIRDSIKAFVAARCNARSESSGALVATGCNVLDTAEGLYLETSEVGGIWMHPAQDQPQRTVYAEAWSD